MEEENNYLVYVLDINGNPLMPTSRCGKVRRWLKQGLAKVVQRDPFTIQLLYEPKTHVVDENLVVKIDDNTGHITVYSSTGKVMFSGIVEPKKKAKPQRTYERKKRRYRKIKNNNRKHKGDTTNKNNNENEE